MKKSSKAERECAWALIDRRLEKQQRAGVFERVVPPKDWGRKFKPGTLHLGHADINNLRGRKP